MMLKDLLDLKEDLCEAINRNIVNNKVEWFEEPQVISNVESSRKGKTLIGNNEFKFRYHIKLGEKMDAKIKISIYENDEDLEESNASLSIFVKDNKEDLEF